MKSKLQVMVVDDDRDLRDSLCQVLEDEGYEARAASNGAEALRALHDHHVRPNLIVLDLMMPVMDGWAFREAQLADASIATIPVVVMTASQSPGEIRADAVIHKPVSLDVFFETLQRHAKA